MLCYSSQCHHCLFIATFIVFFFSFFVIDAHFYFAIFNKCYPLPFSQYSPFIEFCDQLAWGYRKEMQNFYIILLCTHLCHTSLRYLSITCNALISCYINIRNILFHLSTWKAWTSYIVEWMSSSLVYLRDQLTVTTVLNTGETGDIKINICIELTKMCF